MRRSYQATNTTGRWMASRPPDGSRRASLSPEISPEEMRFNAFSTTKAKAAPLIEAAESIDAALLSDEASSRRSLRLAHWSLRTLGHPPGRPLPTQLATRPGHRRSSGIG